MQSFFELQSMDVLKNVIDQNFDDQPFSVVMDSLKPI